MPSNRTNILFFLLLTLTLLSCGGHRASDPKPDFSAYSAAQKARSSWLTGESPSYDDEEDYLEEEAAEDEERQDEASEAEEEESEE